MLPRRLVRIERAYYCTSILFLSQTVNQPLRIDHKLSPQKLIMTFKDLDCKNWSSVVLLVGDQDSLDRVTNRSDEVMLLFEVSLEVIGALLFASL